MMQIRGTFAATLALMVVMAGTAAEYPHTELSPANPEIGDTVTFQYVLGKHSNSCVPTYETRFEINQSPILIYPPQYTIDIDYHGEWPPPGSFCQQVITEYGPTYTFPDLRLGTYKVIYKGKTIETFRVTENKFRIKGKVTDDPYPQKRASLPVAGAKLYVTYAPVYILGKSRDGKAAAPNAILDSAVTEADGSYTLSAPQGYLQISVSADGYDPRTTSISLNKDTVVNFVLLPEGAKTSFSGSVTTVACPGTSPTSPCTVVPVPNCTLTVRKANCWPYYPGGLDSLKAKLIAPVQCPAYTAVTDENGEYLISDIPVTTNGESVTVTASCKGYKTAREESELWNSNVQDIDFQLQPMYGNRDSVVIDGVTFAMAINRAAYEVGDSIYSRYTITNNTMAEVRYGPFSGNCEYDLAVTRDTDTLFRLSGNQICLRNIVYITVPAGSTVTKTYPAWPVPADVEGSIEIAGRLNGDRYDQSQVTVSARIQGSTPVVERKDPGNPVTNGIAYNRQLQLLELSMKKNQTVRVRLFSLNGSLIGEPLEHTSLEAGTHTIPLESHIRFSGAVIADVEGESFRERRLITTTADFR